MQPVIHKKLRKDKIKDGKCPIILQIHYNNQRKQIFTGLFVEKKYWDEKNEQVSFKAPDADFINRIINNKFREAEQEFYRQAANTGSIDLSRKKQAPRRSFFDYGNDFFEGLKHTATPKYIDQAKIALADFKTFAGPQTFQSINAQMLKGFQDQLFKKGKERNTINGKFKKLKRVFKQAKIEKLIEVNPFDIFKPVTAKQTKREHLTVEEIEKIKNVELPESLEHIRNYFLLSCYTGLRFSDAQRVYKEEIVKINNGVERIIVNTTKTDEPVSIKVSDAMREAISKIKKPLPSNTHTNRLLKIIGDVAKIDLRLSFHVSRHTAAVNMASAGIPIEATARILGHSSIRTTAIYYKVVDTILDGYMDKFDDFLKGE